MSLCTSFSELDLALYIITLVLDKIQGIIHEKETIIILQFFDNQNHR